ncbi:MAG: uracil-xanthine permease [Defluviitaleaceae bacterium]|nr:uracil-xanthine permease [Defluviitaleaceae bacterium]
MSTTKAAKMGPFKMGVMGLQHMFAMFGATVLVPLITGLSVQVTLIGVGIGTLIFHFFAKGKVPAFLGSSFAFMAGIQLITNPYHGLFAGTDMAQAEKLAYATGAILVSGLLYLVLAVVVKIVGTEKFMKAVPVVVTAPTVILIGLMLAPWAIQQASTQLPLAVITLAIIIAALAWGKGMIKIIPILLGLIGAYAVALIMHFAFGIEATNRAGTVVVPLIDFARLSGESAVGLPPFMAPQFSLMAILIMAPFALATIAEHIGDMVALSSITGKDYTKDPGLVRTLIGDGLATTFSGAIGGPASTTYGENVGVVALTKVFNPRVVQIAAIFAATLAFSPLFAAVIYTIPEAIIGGASFMLYGMIAAVGIRNMVDAKVDMGKSKNLIIVAVMLVIGLGMRFATPAGILSFNIGDVTISMDRMGLAIAVIVGIILNAVLPNETEKKEAN